MITKEVVAARDAVLDENIRDTENYIAFLKAEVARQEILLNTLHNSKSTVVLQGSTVQPTTQG